MEAKEKDGLLVFTTDEQGPHKRSLLKIKGDVALLRKNGINGMLVVFLRTEIGFRNLEMHVFGMENSLLYVSAVIDLERGPEAFMALYEQAESFIEILIMNRTFENNSSRHVVGM
jgi:hypothetical protein